MCYASPGRGRFIGPFFAYSFKNDSSFHSTETIIYSTLLESPFDTHCKNYKVTQRFCFPSCLKEISNYDECVELCSQDDCKMIGREHHGKYLGEKNSHSAVFRKDGNLVIQSQPLKTLGDLILLMLGLIGLFVGLSLFDVVHFVIDIVSRKYQQYHPQPQLVQDRIMMIALIICTTIAIGFVSVNIYWFNRREAATDAYIGPAKYNTTMKTLLCYDHGIVTEKANFEKLNKITETFKQRFNVREKNFKHLNEGFVEDKKCFFGSLVLQQNSTTMDIITIDSLSTDPFYFSSSIDGMFPLGENEIKVEKELSVIADIYSYEFHPKFTKCSEYSNFGGSKEHCYQSCVQNLFSESFQQVSTIVMIMSRSNLTFSTRNVPQDILDKCNANCILPACKSTRILYRRRGRIQGSIKPALTVTRKGSAKLIKEHDSRTFFELIVFIGILLSTFTGYCVRTFLHRFKWIPHPNTFTIVLMLLHIASVSWEDSFISRFNVQTKVFVGFAGTSDIPCLTIFIRDNLKDLSSEEFPECRALMVDNHTDIIERISIAKSSRYDYLEIDKESLKNYKIQYVDRVYQVESINMKWVQEHLKPFHTFPNNVVLKLYLSSMFRSCFMGKHDLRPSILLHECDTWPEWSLAEGFKPLLRDFGYNIDVAKK